MDVTPFQGDIVVTSDSSEVRISAFFRDSRPHITLWRWGISKKGFHYPMKHGGISIPEDIFRDEIMPILVKRLGFKVCQDK